MRPEALAAFDKVAEQTILYAESMGVRGAVAVGIATILGDGNFQLVACELASQLVRTKLRDEDDKGSDYGAVALAKMMRRARMELEVDTNPVIRKGEVDFRGDAAFTVNDTVYLVTFSGHPTEEVDMKLAMDGLLAFWLELNKPK